jgi:LacI family transcriptional regulator
MHDHFIGYKKSPRKKQHYFDSKLVYTYENVTLRRIDFAKQILVSHHDVDAIFAITDLVAVLSPILTIIK